MVPRVARLQAFSLQCRHRLPPYGGQKGGSSLDPNANLDELRRLAAELSSNERLARLCRVVMIPF